MKDLLKRLLETILRFFERKEKKEKQEQIDEIDQELKDLKEKYNEAVDKGHPGDIIYYRRLIDNRLCYLRNQ